MLMPPHEAFLQLGPQLQTGRQGSRCVKAILSVTGLCGVGNVLLCCVGATLGRVSRAWIGN